MRPPPVAFASCTASLPEPQLPQARLRAVGAQAGLQDEHSRVRGKNHTRHGTCREWRVLGPWGSVVYSYPARAATCECGSRRCVCCCSAARGSGSHCLFVCCAIACRVAGSLCIFARAHKLAPYLHRKSTISSLTVTSQTGSWVAGSRPAVSQNCLKRPGFQLHPLHVRSRSVPSCAWSAISLFREG